jgi:hypothetical protein
LTAEEISDVADDIEALFDAYAGCAVDLSPAFERLLRDLLEETVARAAAQDARPRAGAA